MTQIKLLSILIFSLLCFNLNAQNIDVTVTNVRSTSGQIVIQIFKTHEDYENKKPCLTKKVNKSSMVKGKINFNMTLEPGV
ncbi:MAG: hypothetical protein HYZ42_17015, partial [Bacteroidetes bacterium]|nr:hypothetical protein [Bacteroidota bacterium]